MSLLALLQDQKEHRANQSSCPLNSLPGKMHLLLLLLLLLLACFLPPGTQAGEILGGHEARPHSHPYMACLKISERASECFCGGFLIREDVVLTAAHCNQRSITVILGAHNIGKSESTQQVIPVSRAIPHKNYNAHSLANDIMLLKLVRKARLTSAVQLLRLPRTGAQVRPGQMCSVAGWGRTSPHHLKSSNMLLEVNLIIQDDYQCQLRFPMKYSRATQLCAGDLNLRKNSFKGDSGGPLVCNSVAQGIVSYGDEYGAPPTAYTKISSFLPWIKETLQMGA
ncbi:granzyme B(G,H)-like isoform X1 [Erinaceus europaeus]|uniref:Granzyme B(G,H)-like isoform X1 n=1 Tax=Erinaceus europaeus TaxID=9365 RepID=A0A1S3AMB8_ERIEU|nr:granzyme B(G,H)-like isoform X1 [Erinaceus europaeus]